MQNPELSVITWGMAWYHYEQLSETPVHCVVAIKQKSNLSVREGLDNKHNWRLSCTIIQIYNEPSAGTMWDFGRPYSKRFF